MLTGKDLKELFDEQKSQGRTDEELLSFCYGMFKDGKFSLNDLEASANLLGYDLTEDFKNMSEEEQKSIEPDSEDEEGQKQEVSEDVEEKAKEIPASDENDENDEEDEKKMAQDLYGFKNDEKKEKNPDFDENEEEKKEARKLAGF